MFITKQCGFFNKNIVDLYITYELGTWTKDLNKDLYYVIYTN